MSGEHYRTRFFKELEQEERKKNKEYFKDKAFSIYLNETTDPQGRYILNIFGLVLDCDAPNKSYLLESTELSKTNSATILTVVNLVVANLISSSKNIGNFMVFVTDGAPYCLKIGRELKKLYFNMKHIVCICHNLSLVAEELRNQNQLANKFVSELKHILNKNKANISLYSSVTGLPLIKFPIITRWGTFIDCVEFIVENYVLIKEFIEKLLEQYNILKSLLMDPNLLPQLTDVSSHAFISNAICELENNGLELAKQFKILFSVKSKLENNVLLQRFESIIEKNPDLSFFINAWINGTENYRLYRFLCLTTVCVERSFSSLKQLLSDQRRSISTSKIFSYLAIKTNK